MAADPSAVTILSQLADTLDTLGTIGLAALGGWALYTRRVRPKAEVEELVADYDERLAYVEARRSEEREDKVRALNQLAELTAAVDDVADLMKGVREEVIRGNSRST